VAIVIGYGAGVDKVADDDIEAFGRRITRAFSDVAYRRLREELQAQPDRGLATLTALSRHRSEAVRTWAGGVARKDLGRAEAIVLLTDLAKHPRAFTRDLAMQDLEAIDPELLRPFVGDMRQTFRRSKDLYSPGGAAMWRLARLRDRESAGLFRAYAAKRDPGRFDHRMPIVLAVFLDEPNSIAGRIRDHDHEWMIWLVRAATSLDVPGAEDALSAGAAASPDGACRQICAEGLATLAHRRSQPQPAWDVES
jgi:hypothetical protein